MRIYAITILCSLILGVVACKKETTTRAPLSDGSISFDINADKDTIEMPLSILGDSTIVLNIQAALASSGSSTEHWIDFAVDTTKINDYRSQYGEAELLPTSTYLFYKATTRLPAGSNVSDVAQINIGQQSRLLEYTTYVLPLVIASVDGKPEGAASDRVLYYVFKTGRPLVINKTGWTIEDYSSHFNTFAPANLLDANNTTTYWASDITKGMPQWVTLNFNRNITFTAVSYFLPPVLNYPSLGGYPTSIQIETSMDGTTWEDKGTYAGNIVDNAQTLDIGLTTAQYLRFTSLAAVKYGALYDAVFISGISLMP